MTTREPDPDPNLEAWADAELKRLPPVHAPRALVPSVLGLLRERAQRPWWLGVWWEWPVAAKVASVLAALLIAAAFGGGGFLLDRQVAVYSGQVTEHLSPLAGLWETLGSLWSAVVLVWRVALQPMAVIGLGVVGGLYLVCIGLGTAFVRSIWKRA